MSTQKWQSALARNLCMGTGLEDPRAAVRQMARALLNDAEVTMPPVNLTLLASFQRIREIQQVVMPQAGRLIPTEAGFIVQLNAEHSEGKRRFTFAHEIGHTLMPAFQEHPHEIQDMTTGLFQAGSEEEHLCDVAAAELLMPESLFRPRAVALGCNLDAVANLARVFQASREASAIRLVQMDLRPCAVAVWRRAYKDSQAQIGRQLAFDGAEWAGPERKLRLRYAIASPTFGYFLHRNLAAPADGCLIQCFTDGGVVCGEEHLEVGQRDVVLHVMAVARDVPANGGITREVLSLLLSHGSAPFDATNQQELWDPVDEVDLRC